MNPVSVMDEHPPAWVDTIIVMDSFITNIQNKYYNDAARLQRCNHDMIVICTAENVCDDSTNVDMLLRGDGRR